MNNKIKCLQDCENCIAMKQSVALVGFKIPFEPNIINIIINYNLIPLRSFAKGLSSAVSSLSARNCSGIS